MVAATTEPGRRFVTVEAYLEAERKAEFKSEYWCGEIVSMSGGTPRHGTITVNVTASLGTQLRGTPCQAFPADVKVRTTPQGLFAYPDLSIVCGEPEFHDSKQDVITNPKVLVEVLSPSTEAADRGRKWVLYQQIASLTDYILIAQDIPRIDHYRRQNDRQWLLTVVTGLDAELRLDTIDCRLPLRDIYDRVAWDAPTDESEPVP